MEVFVCISNCVNETPLYPIRPTFLNLYKWPESDVEFMKTVKSNNRLDRRAIDSLYCRQTYLRSYKFSRKKESINEKTVKCLSGIKESVVCSTNKLNLKGKHKVLGRAKSVISHAAFSIFHSFLACTAKVDVAHHHF
ncbi:hypothetical protein VNO77_28973 [Canavalia gladiata]|uniref:Uncharacterized protein n=1 Tax=Canavalia gladiata TaxID=3824 RepID=A0AAN9Q7J5_CANGL